MRRSAKAGLPIPTVGEDVDLWGDYLSTSLDMIDNFLGEIIDARGGFTQLNERFSAIDTNINSAIDAINLASQISDYNLLTTLFRLLGYKKNCVNEYLAGSSLTYENGIISLKPPVIFNVETATGIYLYKTEKEYNLAVTPGGIQAINLIVSGSQSNPEITLESQIISEDFIPYEDGKVRIAYLIESSFYKIPSNLICTYERDDVINLTGNLFNQWQYVHQLGYQPKRIDILVKVQSGDSGPSAWIRPSSDIMVPVVNIHTISFSIFPKVTGSTYYIYYDGTNYYNKILKGKIVIEA